MRRIGPITAGISDIYVTNDMSFIIFRCLRSFQDN